MIRWTKALGIVALTAALTAHGVELKIDCKDRGPWTIAVEKTLKAPYELFVIRLSSPTNAVPPIFEAYFNCNPNGAHNIWQPLDEGEYERHRLYATEWGNKYRSLSEFANGMPICCAFREDELNAITLACSEPMRRVRYGITCHTTDAELEGRFRFFTRPEAPRREYAVTIRVDRRPIFWADAVRENAAWVSKAAGLTPCRVPEAAFDPLYSSWSAFFQDVRDEDIVREARAAAALGMKSAILDDGWQKEDSKTYYSATGDWMPAKSRFPDMRAHVDKVHAAGIRNYLLWLAVPYVGCESQAYARFRGKYLYDTPGNLGVLDPRFPEVRRYLVDTYVRCVKDWDFDGLKLDFIDSFATNDDPAVKDNYAGRDCKTVPEGVERLLCEVHDRLAAIKPDVLIEFRQRYIGPAIRRCGNMLRASDCPYDLIGNRRRVADLRLIAGPTAVHSDMLVWNPRDTPENAARAILNVLFGVVQYSLRLEKIPVKHRDVIRHWIAFSQKHRETLLKGAFRPHHPELMYPVIEAESDAERIVAIYGDGQVITVGGSKPTILLNASAKGTVTLDLAAKMSVETFDTFGKRRDPVQTLGPGLVKVTCPVSGYLKITPTFENPVMGPDWPDPTIWEGGDGWFYSTASPALEIRRSRNLIDWEHAGPAMTPEARKALTVVTPAVWAPSTVKIGDKWNMYVALFKDWTNCFIHVLQSPRPEGPFHHVGRVVDGPEVDIYDVIDPYVLCDAGRVWMFFGSCQDGIHRVELTADGTAMKPGEKPVHVAGMRDERTGEDLWGLDGAWEGTYLYRRGKWWYLFASGGRYDNATYHMIVGRSTSLTGNFVDINGRDLREAAAPRILEACEGERFTGPGHNGDVFTDAEGRTWMFFHAHDEHVPSKACRPALLQELKWTADDWPYFENKRAQEVQPRFSLK